MIIGKTKLKKLGLITAAILMSNSLLGAEYAAKELFAQRQAHQALNVTRTNVTVHEKDMGNGVRCYYVIKSLRGTASQKSAKETPAISCLKVK